MPKRPSPAYKGLISTWPHHNSLSYRFTELLILKRRQRYQRLSLVLIHNRLHLSPIALRPPLEAPFSVAPTSRGEDNGRNFIDDILADYPGSEGSFQRM